MIDFLVKEQIKKYGSGHGTAVCLGDQEFMDTRVAPSTAELFRSLGYAHVDIDYNTKASVTHDLNFPISAHLNGAADILFDGGVMEHVPNIGQVLETMVRLVKVGGLVVGTWPVNHPKEESYYEINPLLPMDFFRVNGFKVLYHSLYRRMNWRLFLLRAAVRFLPLAFCERVRLHLRAKAKVAATSGKPSLKSFIFRDRPSDIKYFPTRRSALPALTSQIFVARKLSDVGHIRWPHQEFYPDSDRDQIGSLLAA